MALQLTHVLPSDVSLADAYHRITWFCGGPADAPVDVQVSIYKNAAARDAGKPPASEKRVSVALDPAATGNILANLYAAVKAMPEYAGATDV